MTRPIYAIARDVTADWRNVSPYAQPYLSAMLRLSSIRDRFYSDDARSIVLYFLSNAAGWRGETAKRLKAELRALL